MIDNLLARITDGRTDLVFEYVAERSRTADAKTSLAELLGYCSYFGDVSAARFLLTQGADLDSLGSDFGLRGAAFHGHWRWCEYVLENGADANSTDPDTGETALHAALCTPQRLAHDLVLQVLLNFRADPNRATLPNAETGSFMRDSRTKGETALHRAAAFGSELAIDLLLRAGAARDAKDVHGDSPLSWASWYARPDAILRKLCFGDFAIHPDRKPMQQSLIGRPQVTR